MKIHSGSCPQKIMEVSIKCYLFILSIAFSPAYAAIQEIRDWLDSSGHESEIVLVLVNDVKQDYDWGHKDLIWDPITSIFGSLLLTQTDKQKYFPWMDSGSWWVGWFCCCFLWGEVGRGGGAFKGKTYNILTLHSFFALIIDFMRCLFPFQNHIYLVLQCYVWSIMKRLSKSHSFGHSVLKLWKVCSIEVYNYGLIKDKS